MYKIRRKKRNGIIFIILGLLAVCALGVFTGYTAIKSMTKSEEEEIVKTVQTSPPIAQKNSTPVSLGAENISEKDRQNTEKINLSQKTAPPENSTKEKYLYLVKYENGITNVYKIEDDGALLKTHTLPVEAGSLRAEDKKALENGIYLKTQDDLFSLTEDFCS